MTILDSQSGTPLKPMATVAPMIFLDGDYLGALAAARHLGERGVPCYLIGNQKPSILGCSKYIEHITYPGPSFDPEALCQFIEQLPDAFTGGVLYPASDDSAYFLSRYGQRLRARFRLSFPNEQAIVALLDKEQLYNRCQNLGISYPRTVFPDSVMAARRYEGEMPVLIKPKTQIYINVQKKGEIITAKNALAESYESYLRQLAYHHRLAERYPSLLLPMIQAFHREAQTDTISVSGYFHPGQPRPIMLFTRKVLQKPKNIGIGLCFKSVPAVAKLQESVAKLCADTGYHGVFEAEFIHLSSSGEYLLMDFNPRLYSQMQFDIERGSLLPEFYYYEALQDQGQLNRLYEGHAERVSSSAKDRYSSYWYLRFTYLTQLISGKAGIEEIRATLKEYGLSHPKAVDACYNASDPKPYHFDQWRSYGHFLRHPRDTYRKFFKDAG